MAFRRSPKNEPPAVFDPTPSIAFGAEILGAISAPHALIGRVAMWYWLEDESDHEFTKDVDFAVSTADIPGIVSVIGSHTNAEVRPLNIGGINATIPAEHIKTDFIDRSSEEWGNLQPLFLDAIAHANNQDDVLQGVPVASPEHLVTMKLGAGDNKNDQDAIRLLAKVNDIDVDQTRRLVRKFLGPAGIGRLEEALRRAGHPMARRAYGR